MTNVTRANTTVLRRLGVAVAVGALAVCVPWLAAKTDVQILADSTAMLMLPGIIPGMIFGARYGVAEFMTSTSRPS